jgi:hypothetical protein
VRHHALAASFGRMCAFHGQMGMFTAPSPTSSATALTACVRSPKTPC